MPTLVGLVLISLGVLMAFSMGADIKKHGALVMKARQQRVLSSGHTIFALVVVTSIILGGVYLLAPATTCSPFAMP